MGKSVENASAELQYLVDNKRSFNVYMIHGGTNFDFYAGANFKLAAAPGYQADLTTYDYDAPINEQGGVTAKYSKFREIL